MSSLRRLNEKQNQLYKFIDELLWEKWDPIGVNDTPEARDEYQSYLPNIFSLALNGGDVTEITDALSAIEQERMGLHGNSSKSNEVAIKILQAVHDFQVR
jgi:hypothetical protein